MTSAFYEIDEIDAVVADVNWSFPAQHAADIEAYWEQFTAGKTGIFNGKVLVQHDGRVEGRVFRASYSVTDYKSFLGFLRLPHESPGARNGFGMAALRSREGAFILGEMGANTANAGKIYFPAGTPDLDDIVDGKVDLAGSVTRELCEETGLTPEEVSFDATWTTVLVPKRAAFMRAARLDMDADDARALILERMRSLHEDELSNIVILRPGDALIDDPRLPDFCADYIRRIFAREVASKAG